MGRGWCRQAPPRRRDGQARTLAPLTYGHEVVSVEHDDNVFRVHTNSMTVTMTADMSSSGQVGVVGGGQSGTEAFPDLVARPATDLPRRVVWISGWPNYCQLTPGQHSQPQTPPTRT